MNNNTMEFHKYKHIESHFTTKFINNIRNAWYDKSDIKWCALEKIHGSNFTIICNGTTIEYARRTAKLIKDESFFNYQNEICFCFV